uniref:Uncharacterized protein n=1 Tax=Rhizophora mucronata TaxID=61149 RepID=A0A2P2IHJ1_RHIMU
MPLTFYFACLDGPFICSEVGLGSEPYLCRICCVRGSCPWPFRNCSCLFCQGFEVCINATLTR